MARLLSTKEPVRIELRPDTVYYLMAPSVYTSARLERAIQAQGAFRCGLLDVLAALKEGIAAILPGDEDAELRGNQLAIVEDYAARIVAEAKEERADTLLDVRHEVHELTRLVRPHFPALAQMEADKDFYWKVYGIEACRLLLHAREVEDGDEVKVVAYKRGPTGLTDDVILEVPEFDRYLLAVKVDGMLSPSEDDAKNSDSPSPGPCSPETSTSAATARKQPRKARSKTTRGRSARSDSKG